MIKLKRSVKSVKKTVALLLAFVFVLALATPVFAHSVDSTKEGSMSHNYDMKMDGTIDLEKQVGHLCNTGAEWKLKAAGEGEMTAVGSTEMVPWKLTADNEMDWVTAPDAVENLTVTSVIELCARPKQTYTSVDYVYDDDTGLWVEHQGAAGEFGPWNQYVNDRWGMNFQQGTPPYFFSGIEELWFTNRAVNPRPQGDNSSVWTIPNEAGLANLLSPAGVIWPNLTDQHDPWNVGAAAGMRLPLADGYFTGGWNPEGGGVVGEISFLDAAGDLQWQDIYRYGHFGNQTHLGVLGTSYTDYAVADLTDQIWAVQVEAEQGMSGNLHQDFEAAYGPYENWMTDGTGDDDPHRDAWGFRFDDDLYIEAARGDDYVGNYFNIDQWARTSDGVTKRYIDISSPWSGAFLSEEMEVEGMTEIEEDFKMMNIGEGEAATPEWWDLF